MKKQFDELSQKVDTITRRMDTVALKEKDSAKSNEKIERLETVVVRLQTEFSRLQRQVHCEQRAGDSLDSSDDKQPAGTCSSQTASKLDQFRAKCESLEAVKRQAEKEKAEDLCLISKLRLELKEKQKVADEEREESERKDLKIDLLRELILEQDRSLKKNAGGFQESQERCKELETISQPAQQKSVSEAFGGYQIKSVHNTTTKEVKHPRDEHESSRKRRRPNSPPPDEEENIFTQHMGDLALRAGYFTVLDDGNFDLNMAASFVSYIGQGGDYRQLRAFFDHATPDHWFCLHDAVDKGTSALGLSVKKCSKHECVRCILVMVTLVDSARQLRFTYDRPEAGGY
jgi:hypothetical protein